MSFTDIVGLVTNFFFIAWATRFVIAYKPGSLKFYLAAVVIFGSIFQSTVDIYFLVNPTYTSTVFFNLAGALGLTSVITMFGLTFFGQPWEKAR